MSEEDSKITLVVILVILVIPIMIAVQGFLFAHLWNILLLPIFPSLPSLSIAHGLGISLVARLVMPEVKTGESKGIWATILTIVGRPLIILACAYIVLFFY